VQNLGSSSLLSKNIKIKIYGNMIFTVVAYGCETWSLTLREEGRLRMFENRVLRRIFGPKREKVTGEWRKLHYGELNDLYSSPNSVPVIKSRKRWVLSFKRTQSRAVTGLLTGHNTLRRHLHLLRLIVRCAGGVE